jgi:hypothetical protein
MPVFLEWATLYSPKDQVVPFGIRRVFCKHFYGLIANLVTCPPLPKKVQELGQKDIPSTYVEMVLKSKMIEHIFIEDEATDSSEDTSICLDTLMSALVFVHNATVNSADLR